MGLQYEIAGNQIDGARDYQEDAFLISHLTDAKGQPAALVIVADGMGGHAAGNVASNMAVQAFNKYVSSNYPSDDMAGLLQGGVLKANGSIAETIRETPALQGMGCTMVAVLMEQDQLWWASVGDSHLYLLRDKELTKKNADHSYGGFLDRLAAAGQPMEPEPGLSRNMLMSAVTGEEITEIDCTEEPLPLQHGDRLLLCSDGLDTLSHGKIIQYSEWSAKARDYTQALLNAVEEEAMPRQDNTTVIVIDVISQDASAIRPPASNASAGLEISDDGEVDLADQTVPNASARATATEEAEPVPILDITAAETESPASEDVPGRTQPEIVTPAASRPDSGMASDATTRRNRYIAIAAAVLVVMIGAYFWLAGSPETGPTPQTGEISAPEPDQVEDPMAPVEPAEPIVTPQSEAEPQAKPESEAAAEVPGEPEPKPEAAPALQPAFTDSLRIGGQGPEMQTLAGGNFMMGSSRFSEERPEHKVRIEPFAISRFETTIAEYQRFARATGTPMPETSGLSKSDHPVTGVTWQQAADYARWLSQQTGHNYRLPTEAEWEYAAAGGVDTDYWWGVTMEPDRAHCFSCNEQLAPQQPTRIGSFAASPYGLHDMLGNVAEWTADCWHRTYDGAPTRSDQAWTEGAATNCKQRVVRGGAFSSPPTSLRHSRRDKFDASSGYEHVGFRVVRDMD